MSNYTNLHVKFIENEFLHDKIIRFIGQITLNYMSNILKTNFYMTKIKYS